MFVNICGAVAPTMWAFLGQMGFPTLFTVAIILLVLVALLGGFALMNTKKMQAQCTK